MEKEIKEIRTIIIIFFILTLVTILSHTIIIDSRISEVHKENRELTEKLIDAISGRLNEF